MNSILKANLLWFVTFWGGSFVIWNTCSNSEDNFSLFLIGLFTVSIGSIFTGSIAKGK